MATPPKPHHAGENSRGRSSSRRALAGRWRESLDAELLMQQEEKHFAASRWIDTEDPAG
jgi:hypothetical protein